MGLGPDANFVVRFCSVNPLGHQIDFLEIAAHSYLTVGPPVDVVEPVLVMSSIDAIKNRKRVTYDPHILLCAHRKQFIKFQPSLIGNKKLGIRTRHESTPFHVDSVSKYGLTVILMRVIICQSVAYHCGMRTNKISRGRIFGVCHTTHTNRVRLS